MKDTDLQDRLVGILIAVLVLWFLAIAGVRFWEAWSKATDSGPMHGPSEWRGKRP